ncbi:MAG: hypothetical protein HC880_03755, partial [Bacteroidia bacterium]|nr:hypothetical protein [Bacteroidia bacterium]
MTATYKSAGQKRLKFRVTFSDGSTSEGQAPFDILSVAPSVTTKTFQTTSDFAIPIFSTTGAHAGIIANVALSQRNRGTGRITKPLIVVEGYDISGVALLLQDAYRYEDFIGAINATNEQGYNFNQALDNVANYDLIFLDFVNGTDDIVRNARAFQQALAEINTRKAQAG